MGTIANGKCGENLTWKLEDGVLTVSGNGPMDNFRFDYSGRCSTAPWTQYKDRIQTIEICGGVTSIGAYAFPECGGLTDISLPDSVTSVGNSAFMGCIGLKDITLPDSTASIGEWAFPYCTGLQRINIPDGVVRIENGTFEHCFALTDIILPDSVTSIGYLAFSNCAALTEIRIPAGVTSIGYQAFRDCGSLRSIVIEGKIKELGYEIVRSCDNLRSISLSDSPKKINGQVFDDARFLLTVWAARTGRIRYKVWIAADLWRNSGRAPRLWKEIMVSGKFTTYDAVFRKFPTEDKIPAALARLQYPADLSEEARAVYLKYLSGNAKRAAMQFIDEDNMEGLQSLARLGVIKKPTATALIDYAIEKGATEFTAYLMNYKNELAQK